LGEGEGEGERTESVDGSETENKKCERKKEPIVRNTILFILVSHNDSYVLSSDKRRTWHKRPEGLQQVHSSLIKKSQSRGKEEEMF
jgi:hypothetical protein